MMPRALTHFKKKYLRMYFPTYLRPISSYWLGMYRCAHTNTNIRVGPNLQGVRIGEKEGRKELPRPPDPGLPCRGDLSHRRMPRHMLRGWKDGARQLLLEEPRFLYTHCSCHWLTDRLNVLPACFCILKVLGSCKGDPVSESLKLYPSSAWLKGGRQAECG